MGHTAVRVVTQPAAPEDRVVAIAGDLVIGPGDVPIGVDRYGTTEAVTHKVHAIADRIVIRNKFSKGPEVGNHDVRDRKSTRLNSSHANISYAVFCLKKKKQMKRRMH